MILLGIKDLNTLHKKINEMLDEVEKDLDMATEMDMYNFYDGVANGFRTVLALMEIPQD